MKSPLKKIFMYYFYLLFFLIKFKYDLYFISFCIKYSFNYSISQSKKQYLDKNHSHFIFVSNPDKGENFGGEVKFRSDLEKEMSNKGI